MISDARDHLLFVEPSQPPASAPLVDALTRKMAGAWRARMKISPGYPGFHQCTAERCYASSDNHDYTVVAADGRVLTTNSLALHYLAHHRAEIPAAELAKVAGLTADEVEPTADEMRGGR